LRTRILRQRVDLLVGRETALLLLGEFQLAVDRNLEHAAARPHIGDLGAGNICEPRSHTESARLIVSGYAVFDDDLHGHSRPLAVKGQSGFIRYIPDARREHLLGNRSKQAAFPARAKKFPSPAQRFPCPAAQGIWRNAPELLGELTPASAESDRRCGKSLPAGNSVTKSSPASDNRSTRFKFILHCFILHCPM